MVFSSLSFLIIFLPLVLLTYYIVPKTLKNIVLLIYSLLFYFIGEPKLFILILLSCIINFIFGLLIERVNKKKLVLIIDIVINLLILGYFKYFNFFIDSFNKIFNTSFALFNIVLPIGISFYTFQTISYVIDIYRGKYKAEKNIFDFSLYVTFFPQLIAGPILRYEDVIKDIKKRNNNIDMFRRGVSRFIIGLSKKVLISNTLAEFVQIYINMSYHTTLMAILVGICIPLHIYFDFSGYTDMAIGLGRMFGFNFSENFKFPFCSRNVTEFWRRWHITLGTWFRNYVYIPLGGNRVSKFRHIINILIVWALTGLWHGASFNFILWGLYYGLLLILEKKVIGKYLIKHVFISHIYLIIVTIVGFEIFNATDTDILKNILELIGIGTNGFSSVISFYYLRSYAFLIILSCFLSTPILKKIISKLKEKNNLIINIVLDIFLIILFILCISYLVDGSYNPFLYFRF